MSQSSKATGSEDELFAKDDVQEGLRTVRQTSRQTAKLCTKFPSVFGAFFGLTITALFDWIDDQIQMEYRDAALIPFNHFRANKSSHSGSRTNLQALEQKKKKNKIPVTE